MRLVNLDEILSEYRDEALSGRAAESAEMERFHDFLVQHGGLKKLEAPSGGRPRILERASALRCFHFSQYLDWFLSEKVGVPRREQEGARATLKRFNEWLLERQAITHDAFEENQESILGEAGPPVYENVAGGSGDEDESESLTGLPEEQDFYVPGEYAITLSGEFVLTKVQEGILYGRHADAGEEIGPILVDRTLSSGHRVGDRVHLSVGKAGDHWNLLTLGSTLRTPS